MELDNSIGITNCGPVSTNGEYFHLGNNEKNYKMEQRTFHQLSNMITSLESKAIKPQCELCGKYFKSKVNLRTHIESVHESSKHPCDMCVYEAPNKYSLKEHKNALHKKIKFPCNQCDHQATTQGHLKRHIQSVHEKNQVSL